MCDRSSPAAVVSAWLKRLRHRGRLSVALPDQGCWHTCSSRSSRITCRSIASQRSTPARELRLSAPPLAGWVGGASELLAPLIDAIQKHVLAGAKLHADDTPMPVLAPGSGKTKTGRLWTYVRDDRPAGEHTAPASGSRTRKIARASIHGGI